MLIDPNTEMIIPASEETYFNTKFVREQAPLCAYDMLYHPPDFNPKAVRSDRTEPQIIWRNIWEQEKHKIIPSTEHLKLGRPTLPILDPPQKLHVITTTKMGHCQIRLQNVIQWAVLLETGKPTICS